MNHTKAHALIKFNPQHMVIPHEHNLMHIVIPSSWHSSLCHITFKSQTLNHKVNWSEGHWLERQLGVSCYVIHTHNLLKVLQLQIHLFWIFSNIIFSWLGHWKQNNLRQSWMYIFSNFLSKCTLIALLNLFKTPYLTIIYLFQFKNSTKKLLINKINT
jgi:hypothetical protein